MSIASLVGRGYGPDPSIAAVVLRGYSISAPEPVYRSLRTVIDALRTPDSIDLAQAFATGSRRARQGVPLPEVQRAFRIGFSGLWDVLLDVVAVADDHQRQALANVATTFWYLIDRFLEA